MLIGLIGRAGSGKSTAARFITEIYGHERKKFAGPLKDMIRVLGIGEDYIEGEKKEMPIKHLNGRSARYAMQTLGTEWGRRCMGEDFWVAAFERHCQKDPFCSDDLSNVVVDDVRFHNEADFIREKGGMLIKINRDEKRGQFNTDFHESETSVNDIPWDCIVFNNTSIADFKREINRTISTWMEMSFKRLKK